MTVNSQRLLLAAAGAGGAAGGALYADDVFSTFLYDGTGSTQTITNGIDLDGEGGLVWCKSRNTTFSHVLQDTERGVGAGYLSSNLTAAENTSTLSSFNADGFTLNSDSTSNGSSYDYVSWTFRKAPGFFDIVTYTGNGVAGRTVAHNLGSVPGMIIVKNLDENEAWAVYHRSLGPTKTLFLSSTQAEFTSSTRWNDTSPTSTVFTVGTNENVNQDTKNYVAYVFAHEDQVFGTDSDESIVKCGSYAGNGSSGQIIDFGFEPQWVMIKSHTRGGNGYGWTIIDMMRDRALFADETGSESGIHGYIPSPNGIHLTNGDSNANESGESYIYMAIRRPHKPPEAGTEVFEPSAVTVSGNTARTRPFAVDLAMGADRGSSGQGFALEDRVRGFALENAVNKARKLKTAVDSAENTFQSPIVYDVYNNKLLDGDYFSGYNAIFYYFRRAPGFFDVVAFTGTGSATTVNHNLAAIPELVIIKNRETNNFWSVYVSSLSSPRTKILILSGDDQAGTSAAGTYWGNSDFTSTQISVGSFANTNSNNQGMIAYLFATLPGISKVGSYSGTGSNIGVDCGFTAGARFVLIKRTDSAGDWYVWDTTRGIVGGNDPYLLLNNDAAQVTNKDYIDPLNSGFTVTSSAIADLNTSGGNYIFLAIA